MVLTSHRVGTTRRAVLSIRGPVEHAMTRFEVAESGSSQFVAACGARVAPYGRWFNDTAPRACGKCRRALRALRASLQDGGGDGAA